MKWFMILLGSAWLEALEAQELPRQNVGAMQYVEAFDMQPDQEQGTIPCS